MAKSKKFQCDYCDDPLKLCDGCSKPFKVGDVIYCTSLGFKDFHFHTKHGGFWLSLAKVKA